MDGKVTVPGIGDTPISFTGKADIVRYVGFIFTDLSVEKLKWKVFRLEGERTVRLISILLTSLKTEDEAFPGVIDIQRNIEILSEENGKTPGDRLYPPFRVGETVGYGFQDSSSSGERRRIGW